MSKARNLKVNFFLVFAGVGLLISFGVCSLMYLQFRSHVKASYFDTLGRVAIMIEKKYPILHDIDTVTFGYEQDEDWFWEASAELATIVDAFNLAYIYLIVKDKGGDGYTFKMSSLLSRNYHPEWIGTQVWEGPIPPEVTKAFVTQKLAVSPRPWVDEWGTLVSAIMPIVTDGKTVALLGVDYNIAYVNALHRRLFIFLVIAFAASAVLTGLLAFFGSRQVLVPVDQMEKTTHEAEERQKEIGNLMKALKTASISRSSFLANLSTEMSNPIHSIINCSSLMMKDKEIIDKQRKNLELITDSGISLLNLINDILDLSKLEAGELKLHTVEYKLANLVNEISSHYMMIVENKPIRLVVDVDEKLPMKLVGDRALIRHLCFNLMDNAFKHTAEGSITFGITCKPEPDYIWLIIKVVDTGAGMSEEELNSLFVDYGKIDIVAKYRAGGTGLGLIIANRMVKLMKGKITATSKQGKGSVFTLCLPQKTASSQTLGPELAQKLKRFQWDGDRREAR
ncbi:MAG: HAMP domain-containing histidine kinase [Treponema sp.]|jgi:signal transduction histidine kinase|nr:HAMP domain-containing histidine kinase [Treponema sp.]